VTINQLTIQQIRPGRCDRVVELKNADADMAARLFSSFFHELADQVM
jgi:ATP-dependent 26S proteasome regulatory subunit